MLGLLGDGWFYVSAAGFIISAVFFVFLLGQYRAAVEAEDDSVQADAPVEPTAASSPQKVYSPITRDTAAAVSIVERQIERSMEKPAAKPEPAPAPAPAAEKKPAVAKENTTGPMSPAVVYLQNMKVQMERLDKDISGLKAIAAQQSGHTDLILKKLSELTEKVSAVADVQRAIAEGAFGSGAPVPAQPAAHDAAEQAVSAPAEEPAAAAEPVPAAEPASAAEPAPAAETRSAPRGIEISEAPAEAAPEPEKRAVIPEDAPADKTLVVEPTVKPIRLGGGDIPLPERPGLEKPEMAPAQAKSDPAAAPTIELSPPPGGEPAPSEAPKPARKGPVWPI